jgi:ACS family pantothenate transporter-like MFS transporter
MAPNAHTIYALRFFLGLLSASFWPSVVALIFNWYKPSELAVRLAFFNVSDVAGAMFLGVLQATLYRDMNGVHGLSGWMWLFIIAGYHSGLSCHHTGYLADQSRATTCS